MAFAVIAFDGPDASRRAAQRDRHIASIAAMAEEGSLLLGLPLHGARRGSLMVVDGLGVEAYLAREPFAADGVWHEITCCPLHIPTLPWRPWPAPDTPMAAMRGHSVVILDGPADVEGLAGAAAEGLVIFAAHRLDRAGAILVTAHAGDTEAAAWAGAQPALRGCGISIHATLFRPLPYRPLPRPG